MYVHPKWDTLNCIIRHLRVLLVSICVKFENVQFKQRNYHQGILSNIYISMIIMQVCILYTGIEKGLVREVKVKGNGGSHFVVSYSLKQCIFNFDYVLQVRSYPHSYSVLIKCELIWSPRKYNVIIPGNKVVV